jgi:predicted DNA-binding ribbon-helix-helix protein
VKRLVGFSKHNFVRTVRALHETRKAIVKSTVIKRSVVVARRKTSISLEEEFWEGLKDIAQADHMTVSALLLAVRNCHQGSLSSAARVFVVDYYRVKASAASADSAKSFETTRALTNHQAQAL